MTFKKIRFVTDSTCDLPKAVLDQWHITVIPAFINIGDQSIADDGVQLDRESYYRNLASYSPYPRTAAPSPGLAQEKIEAAFEDADHLVILTASARLSAIYEALRIGSSHLPPDRVTLIDGRSLTMVLGYQVLIGAEVAAATGDVDQVVDAMQRVRNHCKLAAMVNSLDSLRRSGRLNFAAAGIGELLQIKPIVTVAEGEVRVISKVRTARRAREELINMLRAEAPLDRLALVHADNLEGVAWMREQIEDIAPQEVWEIAITPTVGTHVGAQSIGFVTLRQNWRQ